MRSLAPLEKTRGFGMTTIQGRESALAVATIARLCGTIASHADHTVIALQYASPVDCPPERSLTASLLSSDYLLEFPATFGD